MLFKKTYIQSMTKVLTLGVWRLPEIHYEHLVKTGRLRLSLVLRLNFGFNFDLRSNLSIIL